MEKEKIRLVLLIDPGHGADEYTKGKFSPEVTGLGIETDATVYKNRYREGNFTRLVANALAARINAAGIGVKAIVVVPEKVDIGLTERARRVNSYCKEYGKSNVLLLSVHSNAAGMGTDWVNVKGWLAIVDDSGSSKAQDFANMLYDAVKGAGLKTRQPGAHRKWFYYRECIGKQSRLTILSKTMCPAVLTENFFHTDAEEVRMLASEAGRAKVVDYHYEAVKRYVDKYYS